MNSRFARKIDLMLEENLGIAPPEPAKPTDLIEIAMQLQETISKLQRDMNDTQIQITNIIEQLNASLGSEIRKRRPELWTTLKNGNCVAGYRTKQLVARPDLQKKSWMIDGPLSRHFVRHAPASSLELTSDVGPLADAVSNFFTEYYKSIN
jgi:hypothetical protein